jgi:Trp operon repressor
MSQVSKRKLKKEDFEKIYYQMIKIFSKTGSKKDSGKFLKEFFYTTEKIMLAKRLAIIFMVMEKIPDRKIAKMLSVSTSTIGRIIDKYTRGDYEYISSLINKNRSDFWDIFGVILFAVFNPPSRVGMARYKWFEDAERKYNSFKNEI